MSFAIVDGVLMLCDGFVLLNSVIFKAASNFSKLPAEFDTLELNSVIGGIGIGSVVTIGFGWDTSPVTFVIDNDRCCCCCCDTSIDG